MTPHYQDPYTTLYAGDPLLAYLAGVMDSDGWFTITRHVRKSGGYEYPTWTESIGCGQVGPQAVELLRDQFGGDISLRSRSRKGHPTWRPIHYWRCQGSRAAQATAQLRPYLRIKQAHADIIAQFRVAKDRPHSETRANATGRLRGRALSPQAVTERDALWTDIRSLNDNRIRPLDGAA